MPITRAVAADLDDLNRLFQSARYRFTDFGAEDLPLLVANSEAFVGTGNGVLWGFLSLQTEERPVTMPADAPNRSYLRSLVLRGGYPPTQFVGPLLEAAVDRLQERGDDFQVITYGGEAWLFNVLHEAGFAVADHVQFYQLPRPHRQLHQLPASNGSASLLPAAMQHLEQLAEMDAAAFPPLWHFGHKDMLELLMRTRLQVAFVDDAIAGYTAAAANSSHELQLARLAVHPGYQRRGIGRQLLHDVVTYAAAEKFERIILNTQTDNQRSQQLYRSFGFRPTSRPIPVMALTIGDTRSSEP